MNTDEKRREKNKNKNAHVWEKNNKKKNTT